MRTGDLKTTDLKQPKKKIPKRPRLCTILLFISSLQRSLNICGKTLKAYFALKFMYISVINTQYLTLYT